MTGLRLYGLCSNRKRSLTVAVSGIILYLFYLFYTRKHPLSCFGTNDRTVTSPFRHTLGFIRWNSLHPERIPILEKYRPFFAELHYSMPNYTSETSYVADGWRPYTDVYKAVADTMQILLQKYSNIEGLLYFHFDAWIHPFRFEDMDFRKIWFLDGNGPPFKCVRSTKGWDWWVWDRGYHTVAKQATKNVAKIYPRRYITDEAVFCGGWSDIYYIPRHFFHDFINLGNIFQAAGSFHEVAIPSMINIIDLTYRLTPYHSVITRIGDCWGHCCANGSSPADIRRKRCGHRIDLSDDYVKRTLIDILEASSHLLNTPIKKRSKDCR